MKKWEVKIIADENDADYMERTAHVDDEELERLKRIVAVIKEGGEPPYRPGGYRIHNWENGERGDPRNQYDEDVLSDDDIAWFEENFAPYSDYGLHTIVSVEYYPTPPPIAKFRLLG